MTDTRQNQPLTKDRIMGMQVVDADGFFIGKVRDISLCVGEMDQALVIETTGGEEEIRRWSEVAGAGDLILLKPSTPEPSTVPTQVAEPATPGGGARHCGACGTVLDPGAIFCGSCGARVT